MISLLNKFDDGYVINEEKDVLDIVSFYLKSNDLTEYLKDTSFDNESVYLAYYNIKEKTIILNNEKIREYCHKNVERLKQDYHISDEYYTYYLNFYYMEVLFHELTHAIQKKNYEHAKENSLCVYLYDLCRLLECSDLSFYNQNHDLLPLEIDATNNGYLKSYQLMTYTKLPGKETMLMHLEYLKKLLSNYRKINSFKVLAPLDKLHVKNPIVDIEEIYKLMDQEKTSKIDRLNYGLDISPKEFDSIEKEKRKILLRR